MAADDDPPTDPRNDVVPDTKDWTWVLGEQCPECGFIAADVARFQRIEPADKMPSTQRSGRFLD